MILLPNSAFCQAKSLGSQITPSSLLVLILMLSLVFASWGSLPGVPLIFGVHFGRRSVICFGFTWFLTPQLLPGRLVIPCPTFLPEDTPWGVFHSVMGKVESIFIHITRSAGNFSGMFVPLDSTWDHLNQTTTPCQSKAGARGLHHPHWYIVQTFHVVVLMHSDESCAQTWLAQVLTLARDHPQSSFWMQSLSIGGESV